MRALAGTRGSRGARRRDGGVVLVVALVVLVAVVSIALTLARQAKVEIQVASRTADDLRTRALVDSAVERAIAELKADETQEDTLHDTWRDNETGFRAVQLGEGKFWIVLGEPDPGDGRELKFGMRDEASKLNVNTATKDQLLQIPGMTDEIADCIVDWRDADDDPGQNGAESSYYNSLVPGYACKNGPIESIEELLRVKGIDESVLYGEDRNRNRNGLLDPGEDDGDHSYPPDDANGTLLRGLADYLTVYSFEQNQTLDGKKRLNVLSSNPQAIVARLSQAGMNNQTAQRVFQWLSRPTAPPPKSIADFLDVPNMDEAGFSICADQLTITDQPRLPGLINVNTAAKEVLRGLSGLSDDDVSAIMSHRLSADATLKTPAWLLPVLNKNKLKAIFDQVTTRSWQFTIHAACALDDHPSVVKRVEVVVDRAFLPVRVMWRRDITPLGFPLPNERQPNAAGTDAPP